MISHSVLSSSPHRKASGSRQPLGNQTTELEAGKEKKRQNKHMTDREKEGESMIINNYTNNGNLNE